MSWVVVGVSDNSKNVDETSSRAALVKNLPVFVSITTWASVAVPSVEMSSKFAYKSPLELKCCTAVLWSCGVIVRSDLWFEMLLISSTPDITSKKSTSICCIIRIY